MSLRKSDDFIADVERQFEWYAINADWDVADELVAMPHHNKTIRADANLEDSVIFLHRLDRVTVFLERGDAQRGRRSDAACHARTSRLASAIARTAGTQVTGFTDRPVLPGGKTGQRKPKPAATCREPIQPKPVVFVRIWME